MYIWGGRGSGVHIWVYIWGGGAREYGCTCGGGRAPPRRLGACRPAAGCMPTWGGMHSGLWGAVCVQCACSVRAATTPRVKGGPCVV